MAREYPDVRVLEPQQEGFDASQAIAKAVAILQAHPEVTAALSTTGGGPTTWAGAQKDAGRRVVAVGMDYTRVNLDLVKSGQVRAVIGQPLWDESIGAAGLLDKAAKKQTIPWWTVLKAPVITKADLDPYYRILDRVEASQR
jgi:ribose transport system substrate-binding protein